MRVLYTFCFPFLLSSHVCYMTDNSSKYDELKEFTDWRIHHNKSYDNVYNLENKFNTWRENKDMVNLHNKQKNTEHTLELNKFADMSKHRWKNRRNTNMHMSNTCLQIPENEEPDNSLPDNVDWRNHGLVTHVKNQQQCGSCWAFSAVGSMEGQHAKATGQLKSLSESQIVDCDVNGTDEGCFGGWMDGAFKYAIETGMEQEQDYPYVPQNEPCKYNKSDVVARFTSFKDVTGGENGLKKAVAATGPISVAIDASNPSFQFYKSGVYYEPDCSQTMLDHGVLVVGYNTTQNGTDYWIVKNSWGDDWGLDGYILMSRNRNNSCGIATKPSYPIVV